MVEEANLKLAAEVLRPPLRDRRFWVVLCLTTVVFLVHQLLDGRLGVPFIPHVAHQATLIIFVLPIMYAALNFGIVGAVGTTLLAIVFTVADVLMEVSDEALSGDIAITALELAVLGAVAIVVGRRVEAERKARRLTAAYAAHVLNAHEEERRRISHELHDQPVQTLVHLYRSLDAARPRLRNDSRALAEIEAARATVEEVMGSLRAIAKGLRPAALDDLGLEACVRRLAVDLEKRTGAHANVRVNGRAARLDPATELALFRIGQEALSNVERHAHAANVDIALGFSPKEVSLRVVDDGVGFASGRDGSLGILGMRERAELVGGYLELASTLRKGTRVVAVVPLRVRGLAGA